MIKTYQRDLTPVETCIYTYPAPKEVRDWMGASFGTESKARCMNAKGKLEILTPGREKSVITEGDYILKSNNKFYAHTKEIFEDYFEAIA
jgi:hypothetical protein